MYIQQKPLVDEIMKVDYSFYIERFGGSQVPESAWLSLELKAEKRLEHFSFGRDRKSTRLNSSHVTGQKKTGNKMQSMQSVKWLRQCKRER